MICRHGFSRRHPSACRSGTPICELQALQTRVSEFGDESYFKGKS